MRRNSSTSFLAYRARHHRPLQRHKVTSHLTSNQSVTQIQLGLEIDSLLHNLIAGIISQDTYLDNMRKLAKYVRPRDNEFVLTMDFDLLMKPFKLIEQQLPKQMKDI